MLGVAVGNVQRLAVPDAYLHISKALASGRWWPQPLRVMFYCYSNRISSSCFTKANKFKNSDSSEEIEQATGTTNLLAAETDLTVAKNEAALPSSADLDSLSFELSRKTATPIYAKPRGTGKNIYKTEIGKGGQKLANYVLFEDSMAKAKVAWKTYSAMTTEERDIYMAHLKAIRERQLSYRDPKTNSPVMTVSQHLLRGKCCGSGCRHCPFQHENATADVRKSKIWNGAFYV